MRYYDIKVYNPNSTISPANLYREWTSYPASGGTTQNGVTTGQTYTNDPGALNIQLDIYRFAAVDQTQSAALQIWGVALKDLQNANNFTNCPIEIYAGFQKGLPLNNPNQAGLIMSGYIYQSFGNWQGTDMTLDFVIVLLGTVAAQDTNITLNWLAGTQLSTPLRNALEVAFPGTPITVNISPKLVLSYAWVGSYKSLLPFSQALKAQTKAIIGGAYAGVDIVQNADGSITATDGTAPGKVIQLQFYDLIGQPTWLDTGTIQFVTPMRADITLLDVVQMPTGLFGGSGGYGAPGAVATTNASNPQARQSAIFQGQFTIQSPIHHMGNYRQPDGQSWVTVFQALANVK